MANTGLNGQMYVKQGRPVDAKTYIVGTASEQAKNIAYPYVGLEFYSEADDKKYRVTALNAEGDVSEYEEVGGGKIDEVKVNGTAQPIVNKSVNIPAASGTEAGVVTLATKENISLLASDNQYYKIPVVTDGGKLYALVKLAGNETLPDGSYPGVVTKNWFNKANAAINKVDQGSEFNSSTQYYAGDVVVKDGFTYQFNANHKGEWDESKVSVLNNFKSIKEECLDAVGEVLSDLDAYLGTIINGN